VLRIADIGWTVVSACPAKKFSMYAVCRRSLVDKPGDFMKLLVYLAAEVDHLLWHRVLAAVTASNVSLEEIIPAD
jgi:hypothetical protein